LSQDLETKTLLRVAARTGVGFGTIIKESEEARGFVVEKVTAEGGLYWMTWISQCS
jgi:hypothetical protein